MGLKKKIFGTVAAAALTLSMGAGIASAQSTGVGSAWLDEGDCKVTVSANYVHFGDWVWNGYEYQVPADGANEAELTVDLTTPKNKSCVISMASNGLSYGSNHIPANNFTITAMGHNAPGGNVSTPPIADSRSMDVGIVLNDVPDEVAPGWYEGTVTVTVSED